MSVNSVRGSPDPTFSHIFLPTVVSFRKVTFAFDEGRGTQTVVRPPPPRGVAVFPLGALLVCIRDVFILNKMWTQESLYILVGTLLG
jgi:hypothetical protein